MTTLSDTAMARVLVEALGVRRFVQLAGYSLLWRAMGEQELDEWKRSLEALGVYSRQGAYKLGLIVEAGRAAVAEAEGREVPVTCSELLARMAELECLDMRQVVGEQMALPL